MRGLKRNPWLFGLGVLLAVLVVYGGHARADVTTDQSGSIIVFPKLVADGVRDTAIEIANTDTMPANLHCIRVNFSGNCSVTSSLSCNLDTDCPSGPSPEVCVHQCNEENFDLFLTAQQPTTFLLSSGILNSSAQNGFFPGVVKPVPIPFVGSMKCIETDSPGGAPIAQNSLKGEAIITGGGFGELSEYNAIGIAANSVNGSNTLLLDGHYACSGGPNNGKACTPLTAPTDCPPPPTGGTAICAPVGSYNACPADLVLNHSGEGNVDSFTDAVTTTELTLVPCTDLVEQQPFTGTHALAQFEVVTDMELTLTGSIPFDCMVNRHLADINTIFLANSIGTETMKTRIRPSSGSECYSGDNRCHFCGAGDPDPNCIGQNPGTLVGGPGGSTAGCDCSSDADCPNFVNAGTGFCSLGAPASCTVDSDCLSVTGCIGGACNCVSGSCEVSPPGSCASSGDCATGQVCSGPGVVSLGCRPYPGLLGVAEEFQIPRNTEGPPPPGTAAVNLFVEGSRPGDLIFLP